MTKAYNTEWVRNIAILQLAESWLAKNMLTEDQFSLVKSSFPENFYKPGIFVKIGLFIFTTVACSFCGGFLSLFILGAFDGDGGVSMVAIILAIGFIMMLEFLIKDRKLFHSGVDNALLYAGVGTMLVPFFVLFNNPPVWLSCCFALALVIPAFLRYADLLTVFAAFVILITLIANIMMKFTLGAALVPFGIMLFSALIYFVNRKISSAYYANCQLVISALCLITFYFGGNYYCVREGNALLNDFIGPIAPQIPFASIFYFSTLSIPILYVIFGIREKDRTLLITGLLAFAFSVFTYRYYFGFLTPEQVLTTAGISMIAFSVAVIQFLKTPKLSLTDEKMGKRKLANLEALIASQHLGQAPMEKGVEFGGGNFGGGGSGSGY